MNDNLIDRAQKYLDQLAPHIYHREGPQLIRDLIAEVQRLRKARDEYHSEMISAAALAANNIHCDRPEKGRDKEERRWQSFALGLRKSADRIQRRNSDG